MNNTFDESNYKAMLLSFRICDFQKLLKAFGKNMIGRRSDLQNVALDMLNSKPTGLDYGAYLTKIYDIYFDQTRNCMQHQQTRTMYNMNHNTQAPQQRTQTYYINPIEAKYNPGNAMAINNIQRAPGSYPLIKPFNNIQPVLGSYQPIKPNNNNIQCVPVSVQPIKPNNNNIKCVPVSVQPIGPNNAVSSQFPSNQHNYLFNVMTQNTARFFLKTKNKQNIILTLTPEIIAQFKFKKLPFYEVQEDIIKPTFLSGSEKCSIATVCSGTKESTFVHTMSVEQASLIALNRDLSYGQNKYPYQYQIRFCQLEPGRSEVTDFLPMGLHIRIGEKACTLPPPSTRPRIETPGQIETTRRIAGPIDCTELLKLNPTLANHITLNWLPDEKIYAVAVFLVKKLSSDVLINKLLKKEFRSSEETRNYIIEKLENEDPDFATTSYHFSLLCPLSKSRMTLPAKSIHCDHLQCFDAKAFILMNEKKPTWKCPTCRKPISYEDISIQSYFLEIVKSPLLGVDDEEIELLSDGSWIICKENKDTNDTLYDANSTISIDLDENSDEIATKLKKDSRPEDSVMQEVIDIINVDENDDEKATEPKIDSRPEDSVMQEVIDIINVNENDDEKATEPKIDPRPKGSEKQESKHLKSRLIDLTINEDEESLMHEDKLENEG